ncbi:MULTISPECIES: phage baseplate assembly protein V [Wolbachia]|nr:MULTISPECIES: phage baseplate assembly protein V [Wolbachia]QTG98852.1 phage baseplate assembly protein V [Wolbachia pipientis]UJQ20347.1 phage baseplate assembly protein V [Wolbachia endosymbiont of Delia radicum]UJQ21024.1 phage baseplate assembly protein V [Wolbachia endosymbiont of Delia radicum]
MMNSFEDANLLIKLNNLIRVGTVEEVGCGTAKVRVKMIGNILTDWLPWVTARAGEDRSWSAPSIGEQVIVLSPSGEIAKGIVLPAIYYKKYPIPEGSKEEVSGFVFKDGTVIYYDRNGHKFTISVKEEGALVFAVKETQMEVTSKEVILKTGKSSSNITDEKIVLQVGNSSLEITESGIKLNAKKIDLN